MSNAELISALNDLLTRSHDAYQGYNEAADDVENRTLRDWMRNSAIKRGKYITELQLQIGGLGGKPDNGTSLLADVHRIWMNWRSRLTSGDEAILQECIRGEAQALQDYDKVLSNVALTPSVRKVLETHRRNINDDLVSLKRIESTYEVVA